jgi:methyl-accepting chemotaxis protein
LAWRIILPLSLVMFAAIAAAWIIVPRVIIDSATDEAVRAAGQIAAQFKVIRAYYTENVVGKVVKGGAFTASSEHKTDDRAIPLPATMIHDLSQLLANQDTTINLYSKYPFPNRRDRQLDPFQQEAWDFLTRNPKASFARNEWHDGHNIVRVAVADIMTGQACVTCHNTRADSPKKDWKLGDVRGVLEVSTAIDPQLAHGAALSRTIIIGAAVIGLLLLGISLVAVRSVTKPLGGMVAVMKRLAAGETSIAVPGTGRRDEIGVMAEAVDVFKQCMVEAERMRADRTEQEKRAAVEKKAAMRKLADDFNLTVGAIVNVVSSTSNELEATAGTLARTAETTERLSAAVADASGEVSSNVRSVASASEQLAGSVAEIGRQVQESTRIAQQAVEQAERTNTQIVELSQSAQRVGDVVKLITSVAEQTNLLALNATIEAARAGNAGLGFAVVAQEVKALAAQTAKATDDIATLVSGMQSATTDSVVAIKEIGNTIGRISQIAATLANAVREQDATTREISRNVLEAAQGTTQVAANITHVSRGAGETGTASAQVLTSTQSLSRETSHLKVEIERFLATVRA